MDSHTIARLVIEYRYWILIPLSVLEGPVVAFVAGTLASLGYFNIYALGAFFYARDMIMDMLYYCLGYFGGKTAFAKFLLKKIGVHEGSLEEVCTLWNNHPGKTMFLGKLSYGIAASFIVVAGMVKMRLSSFLKWGSAAAITQYGVLLMLGFFYGGSFMESAARIIGNIQYLIAGVTVIGSAYYLLTKHVRKELLNESHRNESRRTFEY